MFASLELLRLALNATVGCICSKTVIVISSKLLLLQRFAGFNRDKFSHILANFIKY